MEVKTDTADLERNRAVLTQLLMADQPPVEEDPKETTTATTSCSSWRVATGCSARTASRSAAAAARISPIP
jgi:hypothetical protein